MHRYSDMQHDINQRLKVVEKSLDALSLNVTSKTFMICKKKIPWHSWIDLQDGEMHWNCRLGYLCVDKYRKVICVTEFSLKSDSGV